MLKKQYLTNLFRVTCVTFYTFPYHCSQAANTPRSVDDLDEFVLIEENHSIISAKAQTSDVISRTFLNTPNVTSEITESKVKKGREKVPFIGKVSLCDAAKNLSKLIRSPNNLITIEETISNLSNDKITNNLSAENYIASLTERRFLNLTAFLSASVEELINIDKQNLCDFLDNQSSGHNTTTLNFNGTNNNIYYLFNKAVKNNLDYKSDWGWLANYTSAYNLIATYTIKTDSYQLTNCEVDEATFIVKIQPQYKWYSINTIDPNIKVTLEFKRLYNKYQNGMNVPIDDSFKLSNVLIKIPHLLKDSNSQETLQKNKLELYKQRNSLQTELNLNFINSY